ncbi:MAG TPA: hypothetical protein DCX06_00695 [Opitutae bacterium]|nr:hypothetical protein [Opitutae bacterium]
MIFWHTRALLKKPLKQIDPNELKHSRLLSMFRDVLSEVCPGKDLNTSCSDPKRQLELAELPEFVSFWSGQSCNRFNAGHVRGKSAIVPCGSNV